MCDREKYLFLTVHRATLGTLRSRRRKTCSVHRAIIFVSFLFVLCRQWRRLLEGFLASAREKLSKRMKQAI